MIVRAYSIKKVLETGVGYGKSSAYLLLGLVENGDDSSLTSVDLTGWGINMEDKPVGWLIPENLKKNWELVVGNTKKVLPELLKEKTFDMYFKDSDATYDHCIWELNFCRDNFQKNFLSVCDDINLSNAFFDFSAANGVSTKTIGQLGFTNVLIGR